MKKQTNHLFIILNLFLLGSFFSCSSKKIGYFHNRYPSYAAKQKEIQLTPEENSTASFCEDEISAEDQSKTAPALAVTNQNLSHNPPLHSAINAEGARKLNKQEKKEIRKYIKENVQKSKGKASDINIVLLVIIAILLPPVAVLLVDGLTGPFWLSILLTLLFYLPGLIYALYRIFRNQ